jgi:hypothetical protein
MELSMPFTFPHVTFQKLGKSSAEFFPDVLSNGYLADPLQRRQHYDRALLAVCYRYRACSEYNDAFKAMLVNASELWREWGGDEEQNYKIEQNLYQFFMSGLSVIDSLGFCLYFLGSMVHPKHFPLTSKPRHITLMATGSAFAVAFPDTLITDHLKGLLADAGFLSLREIRNILSHRLTGRRSIYETFTIDSKGISTEKEEVWHVSGSDENLIFDEGLIQRHFDYITRVITALISAALEFLESASLSGNGT